MISNASPLIFFSKINKVEILCKVFPEIHIAGEVFEEIVRRGKGSPDSILIQEYIQQGKIKVKSLSGENQRKRSRLLELYPALDKGEAETIMLALQERENEVLMDDSTGRKVAELNGIVPSGSLRVLLLAFQQKIILNDEVLKMVAMLIDAGLYLGADVLEEFYRLFSRIEKKKR